MGFYSVNALRRYIDWRHNEHRDHWMLWNSDEREEAKALFAGLIGASPDEIAFARSTMDAENSLLNGMRIPEKGGNVVTNNLHFSGCLNNYRRRREEGLDVRIVEHRDWRVDPQAMVDAMDDNTRLVAIALVSNVNGFLHEVREISEMAHARGALLYADIVQAAGAIPIDVRQMGIDMAACSTYKFLMGSPGFGFLYIRKELQGYDSPVPPDRHDSHQGGMQKYEVGFPSPYGFVCARESLRYIRTLGVDRIRRHVRSLTDRLAAELPALGYPTVTPSGTDSPIITFLCDDPDEVRRRLLSRDIHVAVYGNGRFRVSPSVFNNGEDIDRLLEALS